MLLEFCSMTEQEMYRMVHEIYREGNVENARWRNPGLEDLTEAIKAEEESFVAFLRTFLEKDENSYYVLAVEGAWVSALRLTKIRDFYYLEALETAEAHRKKGYAAQLIREVVKLLKTRGKVILRDNVSKRNLPSLATHRNCGFEIETEKGINYLSGEQSDQVYGMLFKA